ncbi:MAG: hypothetical protein JXB47_07120 [Anaerolineae bacterium]|nr:hypothetical protein [Anaerolineae bacterium]
MKARRAAVIALLLASMGVSCSDPGYLTGEIQPPTPVPAIPGTPEPDPLPTVVMLHAYW